MNENKRFKHSEFRQDDGQYQYYGIEDTEKNYVYNVIGDGVYDVSEELLINILNELHEENVKLKNSLKEFRVFKSHRIKGAVVTNDNYSVTLYRNNEAHMVCNMLNRFIRSVKNGNKD